MTSIIDSAADYADEAVVEVFNMLRVGASSHSRLKTNEKNAQFDIGKKVILTGWWVQHKYSGGGMEINYQRRSELTALDKVFHMLDGKGVPGGYNSPLIDAINTSSGTGETDFFIFCACSNGNLHITFKRLDLVSKINAIAGNGTMLKGKR